MGVRMKSLKIFVLAVCLMSYMSPAAALAADKAKHPGEETLRKINEKSKPSEDSNKILSSLLGTWKYESYVWVNASAEPEKATGTITNEMILGNRFLSSHVNGNISIDGHLALFKAQGLLGFDKNKGSFSSVWTDTLSTGMMLGSGKYDEKSKTLEETGKFTNPVTGLEEKFRSETKIAGDGNYERAVFSTGKSGKEAKVMQFKYSKNSFSETTESTEATKPE